MIKNPSGLVIRYISHRKVDAAAVAKWKVPTGMTCHLHEFYAREGGSIRILLTYNAPTGTGKTTDKRTIDFCARCVYVLADAGRVFTHKFNILILSFLHY